MDKKKISISARLDQETSLLADSFVYLWRRMYEGCISSGFTRKQAMNLVKTYIMANNPHGTIVKLEDNP